MSALSAAELAQIRADVAELLPDEANILESTLVSDGGGGWTETWGTATAGVACRLDYKRGVEVVVGGALQSFSGWIFTFPHDTAIASTNRIEHGGNTYAVIGEDADKSWVASVRVAAERI